MKKIIFCFVLISGLLFSSCSKEDLTDTTDIAEFEWDLSSLTVDDDKSKAPKKRDNGVKISNDNAYKLVFDSDSTVSLNFSLKDGFTNFKTSSKGTISFDDFGLTKICCESDFDNELIKAMKTIESYQVIGDALILKGTNC